MIIFENNCFYLETENTSYIMRVLEGGILSNAYYGKKIGRCNIQSFSLMQELAYMTLVAIDEEKIGRCSILDEMPTYGRGDYGMPGLSVIGVDKRFVNELFFESYEIINGKEPIKGMPSFDQNVEDVQTLKITMSDKVSGYQAILYYSVFEKENAIIRRTEIVNTSDVDITIRSVASAVLDMASKNFSMTSFNGGWAKERGIDCYELHHGISSVESRKGASGHDSNPSIILSDKSATEHVGDVYGFALVYSGDFKIAVEMNEVDNVRVVAGINPENFYWKLRAGESFETPECVLTYSDAGFNGMSHNFHDLCRNHLGKCADKNTKHPIVINN